VFSVEPTLVVWTSTSGDSAVTVTLSCSDWTCSCASTVSVCPSERTMLVRLWVWKPLSSNASW
jgi:hypothetical protein